MNIVNCTMQQNSGEGLHMQMASTLVMDNGTLQDNKGNGMSVEVGSNATLNVNPNERIRVLRNGGDGILVDGSYLQVNWGTVDVENNSGAAIHQFGGRSLIIGGGGVGGGNLFQGNGQGIAVLRAGSADFVGRNVIRNNGDVGVQILASSVTFSGGTLPDGSLDATVIEGHAADGVDLRSLGELTVNGPHQITSNAGAGVHVERSSLTLQNGAAVSGNTGSGILADANSAIVVGPGASVSGNTSVGIRLKHKSLVGLAAPVTVQGNGVANIACDSTSLAYGQLAGITGVNCEQ